MVCSLRKHIITNTDMCINNQIIDRVENTMFLELILYSHLTWSYHIQHIKLKIAKSIGILCRARKVLTSNTLITLYYAYIYPYLTYCVEVWGSAAKVYITSVDKVEQTCVQNYYFDASTNQFCFIVYNVEFAQFQCYI